MAPKVDSICDPAVHLYPAPPRCAGPPAGSPYTGRRGALSGAARCRGAESSGRPEGKNAQAPPFVPSDRGAPLHGASAVDETPRRLTLPKPTGRPPGPRPVAAPRARGGRK